MEKKYKLRPIYSIVIIIILISLDQITKYLSEIFLKGTNGFFILNDSLGLYYVENTGISFSMLSGKLGIISIVTLIIIAFIIYILLKTPKTKKYFPIYIALIFLLSGALGNLIDRIFRGFVIDFIDIAIISFPIFNLADIYVCISLIGIVLLIIFNYKEEDFDYIFPQKKKEK